MPGLLIAAEPGQACCRADSMPSISCSSNMPATLGGDETGCPQRLQLDVLRSYEPLPISSFVSMLGEEGMEFEARASSSCWWKASLGAVIVDENLSRSELLVKARHDLPDGVSYRSITSVLYSGQRLCLQLVVFEQQVLEEHAEVTFRMSDLDLEHPA